MNLLFMIIVIFNGNDIGLVDSFEFDYAIDRVVISTSIFKSGFE